MRKGEKSMGNAIDNLLDSFGYIASNPGKMLKKYLGEGKKVIGCFPVYVPEEIVYAGGAVPMGLWGGQITPTIAGKYNPIFTCSIMRSCLEYGMTGIYDGLSAVVIPMLCDTLKGTSAAWSAGVKDIPMISFIHPQNRQDEEALPFLASEYRSLSSDLASKTGCVVTEAAIGDAINIYNEHSKAMMHFCKVANDHLDVITPVIRHEIMKSATFIDKSEHTRMVTNLIELLEERPKYQWKGKKVILTGITAEPDELLEIFADNGIAVIGDDLAQESRQYRTYIPDGRDPYERLAKQWLDRKACSTIHEKRSSRAQLILDMAEAEHADGVAVCLMRFCDVEEYEYPFISQMAEDAGLMSLLLEIDQSTQNNEQSRTKIQSFAEM